jgi:hypothetical protein
MRGLLLIWLQCYTLACLARNIHTIVQVHTCDGTVKQGQDSLHRHVCYMWGKIYRHSRPGSWTSGFLRDVVAVDLAQGVLRYVLAAVPTKFPSVGGVGAEG